LAFAAGMGTALGKRERFGELGAVASTHDSPSCPPQHTVGSRPVRSV
jgi:hypothetical protein